MSVNAHWGDDIVAWRKLMPDWEPTLADLNALDELPPEAVAAIRRIARGWSGNDSRWDVLTGLLKYTKRQHAHELAEEIRTSKVLRDATDDHMGDCLMAADLIDPPEVHSDGS